MTRDFRGTGWSFPVETDHRGDVELSSGARNIQEAIRVIIGTAKGERLMRPEFGCDVHDHVFAAVTPATLNVIESDVRESLVRWESRIDVESVEATQDPEAPNRVLIDVEYVIRRTNSPDNLVYPFYLTEATE